MTIRSLAMKFTLTVICSLIVSSSSYGQEPNRAEVVERVQLFDSLDSPSQSQNSPTTPSKMSPSQIRQARALYRSQQRDARIERNLWMGYEPLRPNWNAIPGMSSRYSAKRTVYVPVFIRTR